MTDGWQSTCFLTIMNTIRATQTSAGNNGWITNECLPHSNTVTVITDYKHWHTSQKLMITLHGLFYDSSKREFIQTLKMGETSYSDTSIPLPNWQDFWNFQSFQYHNSPTFNVITARKFSLQWITGLHFRKIMIHNVHHMGKL